MKWSLMHNARAGRIPEKTKEPPPAGFHGTARILLRLAWLAGTAAVIVGSLVPAQSSVLGLLEQAPLSDKAEHFLAYAVLAALAALPQFGSRRLHLVLAFLFAMGAALELGQIFSPGRTCDWHDLLADTAGIAVGAGLVRLLLRTSSRALKNVNY